MIDSKWNQPGTAPENMVKQLQYVPQLYAYSCAKTEMARKFWESLNPVPEKVNIYTTGKNVWSVPNGKDLEVLNDYLGREVSWWWNYPCNDNDVTKLFPMDTYANFADEAHINALARLEADLKGTQTLIINPMQQGEVSKIALFSVADYAWNNSGFNNSRSWEAALEAVVGENYAGALRTVAPYLRYFDADALAYEVTNYRRSVSEGRPRPGALVGQLRSVTAACAKLRGLKDSSRESDRLLYEDLRPWLLKLEAMATETVARLEGRETTAIDLDNNPDFHFPILTGMGDDISLSVKTAEPSAKYLQPLLMELRKN
jgi:hyaluronoglucosaminidase